MKKILICLLSGICALAMMSCQGRRTAKGIIVHDEVSGFTLITDTVKLNLPKNSVWIDVVNYRGQYKLLFADEDTLILTTLSEKLEVLQDELKYPYDYHWARHGHFFVRHDSLLFAHHDKYDMPALLFDCNARSVKNINLDTRLSNKNTYDHIECYEDDRFVVDYLNDGEFGQFVTFFDKDTIRSHSYLMPMIRIIHWHDAYYIVSRSHIFRIDNPLADVPTQTLDHRPAMSYSHVDEITNLSHGTGLNGRYFDVSGKGYITAFVHDGNFYIMENRPNEGFFLMRFVEPDSLQEVLKIATLEWSSDEKPNILYTSRPDILYAPNYSLACVWNVNEQYSCFVEIMSDTIRTVFLEY